MASAAPTPQQLYARLRERYPTLSEEKIAQELRVSQKSLQRLNRGHGVEYDLTIYLLRAAGWISIDEDSDARAQLHGVRAELQRMALQVERLLEQQQPA
jgi:peptidoglycan/xylan/chitin deacetylase (PgdA/CDA1 family)